MPRNLSYLGNGENSIQPTDYEAKYNEIVKTLNEELFDDIDDSKIVETNAITGTSKRYKTQKGEVKPILSSLMVANKLSEKLRCYAPLSQDDAENLVQNDLLNGLSWFIKLNGYINKFLPFVPDKSTLSIFLGFTTQTYNALMQNPKFSDILVSADEYLVSLNTTASQSSLVDGKTTMFYLQSKNTGHSVVKAPEQIQVNNIALISESELKKGFDIWKQAQIGGKK